jgi:hypothetical protein
MSAVPFMGNFDVAVLVRALHESGRGRVSCHVATVSGVRALHLHQEKEKDSEEDQDQGEDQGDQGEEDQGEDQEDQGEDQGEEELRRVGFIVNTQVASCVPLTSPSRHWFAVWRDPGTGAGGVHAHAHAETQPCLHTPAPPSPSPVYWNLDSKLSQPESFRSCDELRTFLCELVQHHAAQVFEVVAPG